MKNYKVKYIIQTSSRTGKYNYNCIDTIKANSEEEAKLAIKANAKKDIHFKRYKIIIKSVEEVDLDVEIHI